MDSVEILMSISEPRWHGRRMTTTGGTGRGATGGTRATVAALVLAAVFPAHARGATAGRAHRRPAGPAESLSAVSPRGHVPIVITPSSGFLRMGGLLRVVLAAVMLVLAAAARATRLAVEATPVHVQLRGAA
jgi:hypothetical protein